MNILKYNKVVYENHVNFEPINFLALFLYTLYFQRLISETTQTQSLQMSSSSLAFAPFVSAMPFVVAADLAAA